MTREKLPDVDNYDKWPERKKIRENSLRKLDSIRAIVDHWSGNNSELQEVEESIEKIYHKITHPVETQSK